MNCAAARSTPRKEKLSKQAHPAITRPTTLMLGTAKKYNTPTLRSLATTPAPSGKTTKDMTAGTAVSSGPRLKATRSALAGRTSSFIINLIISATVWSNPCGPVCTGPMRICMRADTFRSTRMNPAVNPPTSESRMTPMANPHRKVKRALIARPEPPCAKHTEAHPHKDHKDGSLDRGPQGQIPEDSRHSEQQHCLHVKHHEDESKVVISHMERTTGNGCLRHTGLIPLSLDPFRQLWPEPAQHTQRGHR